MKGPFQREWRVLFAVFAVLMLSLFAGGCNRSSRSGGGSTAVVGGGGGGGALPPPAEHASVVLRDVHGDPIPSGSNEAYSPRKTCGVVGCHDVDVIANGYHFQQGRTDLNGNIVTKDDYFGDGRTFLKSAGMYGKW